ncbi:MAG: M2 family metallopeptidase [candidate division Zixibacteria bacterium]|nr:M2 family metallopeptidase [candidate division Zixibacteria bacterium]
MKRYHITAVALILLTVVIFGGCKSKQAPVGSAADFITDFESKIEFLHRKTAFFQWEYLTTGKSDSLEYYQDLHKKLISQPELPVRVKRFLIAEKDYKNKRKLELINRAVLKSTLENRLELKSSTDSIIKYFTEYQYSFEGKNITFEKLDGIIGNESSRQRRKEAYFAQIAPATQMNESITRLIRLRNQMAAKFGYKSYYDMMLAGTSLDKSELSNLVDEIEELTAEPYRQLIDSLKTSLKIKQLGAWDLDFLFRRAISQSASYFTGDKQMRMVRQTFAGLGLKLDDHPIYIKQISTDIKTSNSAILLPIAVPYDVRIAYTVRDGKDSFDELVGTVGEGLYGCYIDKTDYLFSRAPSLCFERGICGIFTRLTFEADWNRKYAGMPEPLVLSMKTWQRFERLFEIRLNLARLKFELEIYKDPFADMNSRYTSIYQKYTLLDIKPSLSSWAMDIKLVGEPVSLPEEIIGYCIEGQIRNYITEKYGTLLDNQRTREFMVQNVFRFGGKEDWRTLLERATGEEFTAKYILADIDN